MTGSVAVIGSGVIGLTSALHLKETHRDCDVTVMSDVPISDITSIGPPGIVRLHDKKFSHWYKPTVDRLRDMVAQYPGTRTGVHMISGFRFDTPLELQNEQEAGKDCYMNYKRLDEDEVKRINPNSPYKFVQKNGAFLTTYASQGRHYVPWLIAQLKERGVKFEKRKIESFDELADGPYDAVINAAGIGAQKLTKDFEVTRPRRGVLIEVEAPWIKHFYYEGNETYCILGVNSVILGGLKQMDRWDRQITDVDRKDIWQRCTSMVPTLKHATVLGEWCGLRPFRGNEQYPRLEIENYKGNNRDLKVIHNYGHGGSGFILSWGCAQQVTQLFDQSHMTRARL